MAGPALERTARPHHIGESDSAGPTMYDLIHALRLRLWRRQVRAMARECRVSGTSDGDWIAATVAASATSSGPGAPVSCASGAGP
ncbi:hypothetical protein SAMN02799622_04354 [Methylobacterium sp. UNC378MF]|nr:hypothetical protein SAMN02799622_04354 [Methylobacterium sp. UNC378MF]